MNNKEKMKYYKQKSIFYKKKLKLWKKIMIFQEIKF